MFSRDKEARRRIDELEEKFLRLSRDFHALSLEWDNAYDKLRTMMGRVSKRAEVLQKEADGGRKPLSPEEEAIRDDLANAASQGGMLTPRQKAVQQAILKRRAGIQ